MADTVERAKAQIGQGTISQSIADQLGITGDTNYYDMDLSDWAGRLRAGDSDVTMADVISDPQSQQLSALQQLSGIDPSSQFLGEKQGEMLSFEDPTSGGMISGRDFAGSFQDAARAAGQGFDDSFFDRSMYDVAGGSFTDDTPDAYREGLKNVSLMDEVNQLSNVRDPRTGELYVSNLNTQRADDMTSREQLQNVFDSLSGANQELYGQGRNQFQAILDAYDKYQGNKLRVTPEEDIESGGFFNVT